MDGNKALQGPQDERDDRKDQLKPSDAATGLETPGILPVEDPEDTLLLAWKPPNSWVV